MLGWFGKGGRFQSVFVGVVRLNYVNYVVRVVTRAIEKVMINKDGVSSRKVTGAVIGRETGAISRLSVQRSIPTQ